MQSFLHKEVSYGSGYFHVWISSKKDSLFFAGSTDKAFFISLIQDNLSPRHKLDRIRLTTHGYICDIELLAYSLTKSGVHILVHTTRKNAVEEFGQALLFSYETYLASQHTVLALPFDTLFIFDKLVGRHEALRVSREIHLLHEDWRNDRYSSIGFYLDDRRGDWMNPHRLTVLFGNRPDHYTKYMESRQTESDRIFEYIET